MCTALGCIDIIDKAVCALCVGIIVLHGNFNIHIVLLALKIEHIRINRRLTLI